MSLRIILSLATSALAIAAPLSLGQSEMPVKLTDQVYKTTPQGELTIHAWQPREAADTPRPAIVFFHGGGWNAGKPGQFFGQAKHLAQHGMVAFSAQYRLKNTDDTTPVESLKDAISALRWVRAHAEEWGVDPDRIAAGGGSAGGQLAAATATLSQDAADQLDEDPDTAVSFRPQALVLFNPVYDNGPDGYGQNRFGDDWQMISPLHNIHGDMPPTLVMLGDQDDLIPVATAENFRDQMTQAGVRSELIIYPGESHGFFNRGGAQGAQGQTIADMTDFLRSLGWID